MGKLMERIDAAEILDSRDCPASDAEASLRDLSLINRWFGGVSTTRALIERVAEATAKKHFSVLEVAAGFGEVPREAARQLARKGIALDLTYLDRMHSHLLPGDRSVAADALALPFPDNSFDLISNSLFVHHLQPDEVARFAKEALRVSRCAVLINDLVRHPLHLALAYAGWPLMRSYVSRADGVASVRRSYIPEEMRGMIAKALTNGRPPRIEIARHYLFRMGVVVWKSEVGKQ
jgi:ubiquinone/menaquinone biosynthesis C-methylase UbiE